MHNPQLSCFGVFCYLSFCAVNLPSHLAYHVVCVLPVQSAHMFTRHLRYIHKALNSVTSFLKCHVVRDQQNVICDLAFLANRNLIFRSFTRHGTKFAILGSRNIVFPFHEMNLDQFNHDPHYQLPTDRVRAILLRLDRQPGNKCIYLKIHTFWIRLRETLSAYCLNKNQKAWPEVMTELNTQTQLN